MKKIFVSIGLTMAVFSMLPSCVKEDALPSELYVYMTTEFQPNNIIIADSLPIRVTTIGTDGDTILRVSPIIRLTRAYSKDVEVLLGVDTSLVNGYNQANSTSYVVAPPNTFAIKNLKATGEGALNKFTIKAGQTICADSFALVVTNPTALLEDVKYLVPVQLIQSTNGVNISASVKTLFVAIPPVRFTNLSRKNTAVSGTNVDRTAWGITVSTASSGANVPARMIDNNYATYWQSMVNGTPNVITVDMKQPIALKGFNYSACYSSKAAIPVNMKVMTSSNGTDWVWQGHFLEGTKEPTTSTVTNPTIKGVEFLAPVTCRYLKIECTKPDNFPVGFGALSELFAIQ